MPKVIVYVPAAAWRKLEERGLDPAATVREFAKRGYEIQSSGAAVGEHAVSGSAVSNSEEQKGDGDLSSVRPERAAPDSQLTEGATITGERRTVIPDTGGAAASSDDKAAPTRKGQEAGPTPFVPAKTSSVPLDGKMPDDVQVIDPRIVPNVDALPASVKSPKNYRSEPFSLVCKNRAKHEAGVYCSECEGDGGR